MTGSSDAEIAAIAALEAARQAALIAADLGALDRLLAEDLIHIHSTGEVHDKPALLAHVARMGGFIAIERPAPQIRLMGELALIAGPTRNTVRRIETGETATLDGFSTLLLRRGPSGWQVALSQITPRRLHAAAGKETS